MNEDKSIIQYDIPVNAKEECDRINKSLGTSFRSTEEHIDELLERICDTIYEVGDKGGWFLGDGIKVKVEIEYDPENK